MQTADNELIQHLNAVLRNKLTGINQYFLHARILKHKGNLTLADYEYRASIDAMKHSDMLVEHVLSLGGIPNLQELGHLMIGDCESAMLHNDLTLAEAALANIKTAIAYSHGKQDLATAGLLGKILAGHQEHIDFITKQINSNPAKECA
jgi:bacterioferritin